MEKKSDRERSERNREKKQIRWKIEAVTKIVKLQLWWENCKGSDLWKSTLESRLSKVLRTDIPEKRKIGRPKTGWKETCQRGMKSTGPRAGEELERATWSKKTISHVGDPIWQESQGKRRRKKTVRNSETNQVPSWSSCQVWRVVRRETTVVCSCQWCPPSDSSGYSSWWAGLTSSWRDGIASSEHWFLQRHSSKLHHYRREHANHYNGNVTILWCRLTDKSNLSF